MYVHSAQASGYAAGWGLQTYTRVTATPVQTGFRHPRRLLRTLSRLSAASAAQAEMIIIIFLILELDTNGVMLSAVFCSSLCLRPIRDVGYSSLLSFVTAVSDSIR